ncbi:MAG: TIGR01212 family radical SAM protein [Lachnospiraceae bacterium]|nr:TIGR01212 family radical SAM protein [Lachnospiraceae bacterium]
MRRLSDVLKAEYGEKIYRLALSSGCTCPNRDGTVGTGGCTFCSEGGSGDFAAKPAPVAEQIEEAKRRIRGKTDAKRFIAYYQSFTNTYGDPDRLRALYMETVRRPEVAVLALGTRPDCLGPEMMDLLTELDRIKPVWVELGLQTVHGSTARAINRCYSLPVFEEAYARLKEAGLTVIVHVIFGLPGETKEDMLDTVRYLAGLKPVLDGVKLQMLHVLKGTELGRQYEREPFPLLSLEEYAELIAESVGILPEQTVLHRMTGDGPKRILLAPDWTKDKKHVLNTLNRAIAREERRD